MPTVTLNRTVLESLIGKKLPLDQLKHRIAMIGTDLERIDDKEIVVEVFPNRPDMLSEQGFARALRSFIGAHHGLVTYPIKKSGCAVMVDSSVSMRPYTACAIVKNLKLNDERIREIMQVQEKLSTTHGRNRKKSEYGIYPLERIHFPVSYKALDPTEVIFQPLGFEKPMKAHLVPEQHPKGKAYKHLTIGWKKYPFFIDAHGHVMSMLPFTNSHETGRITESTRDVFIECTGVDYDNVSIALNILVTMLADMGGVIYSVDVHYPGKKRVTPDLTPTSMKLDIKYVNKLLGLDLSQRDIVSLLGKMGYSTKGNTILVPAYRSDILHPADLVEDIAIAYGYDLFPSQIPKVATIAEEDSIERFKSIILDVLVGAGFQETRSYHLMGHEEITSMMNLKVDVVHIKNALVDYGCMRNSILPSLLKILQRNQHQDYPQQLAEFGMTFHKSPTAEYGIKEQHYLGIAICHEKSDFTHIRQVIDSITRMLGLKAAVTDAHHPSFIDGRAAQASIGNDVFATFGEVNPYVLTQWNMQMPVAAAEIDIEKLFTLSRKKTI